MHRFLRRAACCAAVAPSLLAAQSPAADTTTPATTISGYLTTSWSASTHAADRAIVGRLYGRNQNQFTLNVADLVFARLASADRWDAGFHFEPTVGLNSAVVKSAGLDLGADADIWQAYVTLNIPHSANRYFQVKAGKMATLMGVESFEDVNNPNLDVGNQDIFLEPFTETGVELDGHFGVRVDAEVRLTNGWDLVTDNNRGKSVMLRFGLAPDTATSVAVVAYTGPEQPDNTGNDRSGANLVASRQFHSVTTWLQLDYGREPGAAAAGRTATWTAAGFWLRADLAPKTALGFRADWMDDCDGARTSGVLGFPVNAGQTLTSVTATLILRQWPDALVRPEIRFDHSSLAAFNGHNGQMSLGLGVSYLFAAR